MQGSPVSALQPMSLFDRFYLRQSAPTVTELSTGSPRTAVLGTTGERCRSAL